MIMMIKTRTTRVPGLTEYVKTNHPFDMAEVITTSIEKEIQPYLDCSRKIMNIGYYFISNIKQFCTKLCFCGLATKISNVI